MSNFRLFCLTTSIALGVLGLFAIWFGDAGFERRAVCSLLTGAFVVGFHGDRKQRK
ncbi:hypothetical protein [Sphingomonas sp.]|uniref:hypothetical protein n=1 Tax=Sphingomonas sp. TaxID=28214 RepID=UPI002FDA8348